MNQRVDALPDALTTHETPAVHEAPVLGAVGTALPPHRYEQDELIAALTTYWAAQHHNPRRLEQFHRAVQVGGRNLALPLEAYDELDGFTGANNAFIRVGTDVAQAAVEDALARAGLAPSDVDAIFFTTVTGLATPTLDARLVNRLGLRRDVKRTPMFGLGCVAGAAGVARMNDYLRAFPEHVALLVSVELCSLTLQRGDLSVPNLISSGLFGDGAACVIGLGAARAAAVQAPRPRVMATRSAFYPDTERVMGWDISASGFQVVLSADVPKVVQRHIAVDVDAFLADVSLTRDDITTWVCHPGGPKVLTAFEDSLGITREDLALTWRSLHDIGNLSSASVLFVLGDTLAERTPPSGSWGLMLAMGPGFCAELVLLRW